MKEKRYLQTERRRDVNEREIKAMREGPGVFHKGERRKDARKGVVLPYFMMLLKVSCGSGFWGSDK